MDPPKPPLQFPHARPEGASPSVEISLLDGADEIRPSQELTMALRAVAVRELGVGTLLLGVLLVAQGIGAWTLAAAGWTSWLLCGTGLLLVAASGVMKYVDVTPRLAHPAAMAIALQALLIPLVHLAYVPSASASVHLLLVQVAAALLFVSPQWYSAFAALSVLGWAAVATRAYTVEDWAAYGPAMLAACVIGLVLQLRRTRSLTRLTAIWLVQQRRAQELETAVDQAARSREELVELSVRDPLTGAYNRRYLEQLEQELERPTATWGCLLIDLDGFKAVNDRFGHDEGDRVLEGVAHFIRAQGRAGDRLVRLGGDEFVFIMELKNDEEMHLAADRLEHKAKKESPCPFSVGRAFRRPGETLRTVLQRADAEMYRQKKGRGSGKTLRMRPIVR